MTQTLNTEPTKAAPLKPLKVELTCDKAAGTIDKIKATVYLENGDRLVYDIDRKGAGVTLYLAGEKDWEVKEGMSHQSKADLLKDDFEDDRDDE